LLKTFLAGKKQSVIGLDYGGGNGKTSDLMRQSGWTFDSCDPFGRTNMSPAYEGQYNFCSAIEVFEHSPDPVATLREVLDKASSERVMVMIGTGLCDGIVASETRLAWWYAAPRNGHVSLYSSKSLELLGAKFGLARTAVRGSPTFLTRGFTAKETRTVVLRGQIIWRLRLAVRI
jgi:hypothetical protein